MAKHIGIVACSAEGAALCYRTICVEGAERFGAYGHPEVSLHSTSLATYVERINADDWHGVGDLMLESAAKLARIGADFLICPDNTIHHAFAYVEPRSPLPWLHIARVIAEEATVRGYRRLGLLGTHWLVKSEVYPVALEDRGIECLRPSAEDRLAVGRIIMDELVNSRFLPESTSRLVGIIDKLKDQGAEAMILGCTELPFVLNDENSPLPTLDSTRLLARAALRAAEM